MWWDFVFSTAHVEGFFGGRESGGFALLEFGFWQVAFDYDTSGTDGNSQGARICFH